MARCYYGLLGKYIFGVGEAALEYTLLINTYLYDKVHVRNEEPIMTVFH